MVADSDDTENCESTVYVHNKSFKAPEIAVVINSRSYRFLCLDGSLTQSCKAFLAPSVVG